MEPAAASENFEMAEETISTIAVAARIPVFWQDQPRLWFIQAEAVLQPQHTSDEAKYHLVIAKLGKEVITQVTDILVSPPKTGKYEALKTRLLAIYEESQGRQIQKLIGEMELGDQKPSQLLRKMRNLASNKVTDETLTILWQNHLPTTVRGVLAVADSKDLNTLALIADKVMETARPIQAVSRIDQEQPAGEISELVAEIRNLSAKVRSLEAGRGRSRYESYQQRGHRSTSQGRGRSSSRRRTPADPDWLCSYHFRYKHKAFKCVEPCSWIKRNDNFQPKRNSSQVRRIDDQEN